METPQCGRFPVLTGMTSGGSTILTSQTTMRTLVARSAAVLAILAALSIPFAGAFAQGGDQKPPDAKQKDANAELVRKTIEEIAEVGRQLTGPAANPECYWLGKKVINLMVRDDVDTGSRPAGSTQPARHRRRLPLRHPPRRRLPPPRPSSQAIRPRGSNLST